MVKLHAMVKGIQGYIHMHFLTHSRIVSPIKLQRYRTFQGQSSNLKHAEIINSLFICMSGVFGTFACVATLWDLLYTQISAHTHVRVQVKRTLENEANVWKPQANVRKNNESSEPKRTFKTFRKNAHLNSYACPFERLRISKHTRTHNHTSKHARTHTHNTRHWEPKRTFETFRKNAHGHLNAYAWPFECFRMAIWIPTRTHSRTHTHTHTTHTHTHTLFKRASWNNRTHANKELL